MSLFLGTLAFNSPRDFAILPNLTDKTGTAPNFITIIKIVAQDPDASRPAEAASRFGGFAKRSSAFYRKTIAAATRIGSNAQTLQPI